MEWRDFAISEYDYSSTEEAKVLDVHPRHARLFMVVDHEWKFIFADGGFRPMLFDLTNDPDELHDLGDSLDHTDIIEKFTTRLAQWARRPSQRTTMTHDQLIKSRDSGPEPVGLFIGVWHEDDRPAEMSAKARGKNP